MDADAIIRVLGLEPHAEGGWFVETYRAPFLLPRASLPVGYAGDRNLSTAIYYLLRRGNFSAMHRVMGDEILHHYLGDPVELLRLYPDGSGDVAVIGPDLESGMRPQVIVPGGTWQGARVSGEGEFALLGTTMAPGFDYADFLLADRSELIARYPDHSDLIEELAR